MVLKKEEHLTASTILKWNKIKYRDVGKAILNFVENAIVPEACFDEIRAIFKARK